MRRTIRGRLLVPAALLGCVGVFGLLAFAPSAGSAAPGTATPTAVSASPTPISATAPSTTSTTQGSASVNGANGGEYGGTAGAPPLPNVPDYSDGVYQPGAPAISPVYLPDALLPKGEALFAASCASCHGPTAAGTAKAPDLQGLGSGTVDFWVGTGRMPLRVSSEQATRKPPLFNRSQTLAIAAYVESLAPDQPGSTTVPKVNLYGASISNGAELFTLNCAACHTITGAGDELAYGAYAPSLHLATVQQIVEAIRSGPGNMPHFGPGNITDVQARDIAAYVHGYIQHPVDRGGYGLGGIGPVGEGFVGLLLGVGALMLVCFWIGDRT